MQRPGDVHVPVLLRGAAAWGWRILVVVGALYVLLEVVTRVVVVIVPVVVALFIAAVLEPLVQWLADRRVPRGAAACLVFLGSLLALAGLLWWFGTTISQQLSQVGEQLLQAISGLEQWLTKGPLALSQEQVQQLEGQVMSFVSASNEGLVRSAVGRAQTAGAVLGAIVLMLFVLFMVLYDGRRMAQWLADHIPDAYRDDAIAIGARAQMVMQQFLVAMAVTGLLDALLIALALVLIGVPLVLPLAILTFFGAFFPLIGALVAGFVSAIVALVSGGLQDALLVVGATIIVQQLEGNVFQPFILGRGVQLHPAVTAVTVSAGLVMAGLIGAFLAVPIVAILTQVMSYYADRGESPLRP